eukprot:TRINITY_DN774_c0_g1_i1.p1 TRINITY_DN774_c0_g1~~TRINITY_DN774_c0_g1_i1.p1  ORF type:complete len:345 (-),score=51.72 TRINITY_DN774_c0_g1_i1:45-1079(-)
MDSFMVVNNNITTAAPIIPAPLLPLRPYQHGDPIKVLTMNTAFLPSLASKITAGGTHLASEKERLELFIQTFNQEQYDIICLQEMFNVKLLKQLFTCLNASQAKTNRVYSMRNAQGEEVRYYFYAPAGLGRKSPSLKSGSGLVILSKFPVVKANAVPFKVLLGTDWFTHKGFIHVEIDALGRPLHFANTHSQANPDKFPLWWLWSMKGGSKVQCYEARATHHQQMRLYLMRIQEEMNLQPGITPNFFLMGDLNVIYGSQEYTHMMSILGNPVDVVQAMNPGEKNWTGRNKRLDYILSYNPYHNTVDPYGTYRVDILSCNVTNFQTAKVLSDHKGIEMIMRFVEQ